MRSIDTPVLQRCNSERPWPTVYPAEVVDFAGIL